MITATKIIIITLVTPLLFSCSNPEASRVCTAEFVVYSLTVLTPEGEPADSVQITVSNKKTNTTYDVCDDSLVGPTCGFPSEGQYVIFHDGFLEEIDSDGEEVIVNGTKGNKSFTEQFVFRDDGCHIQKVVGPDSVYLHVNNLQN